MRPRALALAALLAASTASADWPEIVSSWHEIQNPAAVLAPPTCTVAGQVGVFLGSPLALGCDAALTYTTATKTLNAPTVAANNVTATALATPTITSVTPVGTTGAVTYGYKVVAYLADGTSTAASAESTTTTSNATLSASNFNRLTWSAVTGAASYRVYRTVAPTSPNTTGIIYSGTALTVDDTGLAGGGETAPTSNLTGTVRGQRALVGGTGVEGFAARPVYASAETPGSGMYFPANLVSIAQNGGSVASFGSATARFLTNNVRSDGTFSLNGTNTYLAAATAGLLTVGTTSGGVDGTTSAATFILNGTNGATWTEGYSTELVTLSTSGTTTDTSANLLPANSQILGVVARVTTTITTATDWKLGDATTPGRFSAANATMTSGTTQVGMVHLDQTGAAGPIQTSAAKVRITTTGTPGAGAIRLTVFYRTLVPPTS